MGLPSTKSKDQETTFYSSRPLSLTSYSMDEDKAYSNLFLYFVSTRDGTSLNVRSRVLIHQLKSQYTIRVSAFHISSEFEVNPVQGTKLKTTVVDFQISTCLLFNNKHNKNGTILIYKWKIILTRSFCIPKTNLRKNSIQCFIPSPILSNFNVFETFSLKRTSPNLFYFDF